MTKAAVRALDTITSFCASADGGASPGVVATAVVADDRAGDATEQRAGGGVVGTIIGISRSTVVIIGRIAINVGTGLIARLA